MFNKVNGSSSSILGFVVTSVEYSRFKLSAESSFLHKTFQMLNRHRHTIIAIKSNLLGQAPLLSVSLFQTVVNRDTTAPFFLDQNEQGIKKEYVRIKKKGQGEKGATKMFAVLMMPFGCPPPAAIERSMNVIGWKREIKMLFIQSEKERT